MKPHYDQLGRREGLTGDVISALFQDHDGFLWIGTIGSGLNRFDGHEVKIWRHNDLDSASLCSDVVRSIMQDAEGNLWIGTTDGISRLNPHNGHCDNYIRKDKANMSAYLFLDPEGTIWAAAAFGLFRYHPNKDQFERLPVSDSLVTLQASAADRHGRLWLGGFDGLTMFDPKTNRMQRFFPYPDPGARHKERNITNVKIDRYDNIWVFTWGGGLHRFHPETGRFESFVWDPKPQFPGHSNIPFDIAETFDVEGRRIFWIAAEHGVFRFPLNADEFPSLDKPHTLLRPGSDIDTTGFQTLHMLTDANGNLWFGTVSGVFRYNIAQEFIRQVQVPEKTTIECVSFTPDGGALVSSILHYPLIVLDAHQQMEKVFTSLPPGTSRPGSKKSPMAIQDARNGHIYAGMFEGLVELDPTTWKARWFRRISGNPEGVGSEQVTHIQQLDGNRLLLGFWQGGLQVFDTGQGKGVWKFQDKNRVINCIKHIENTIWVGTEWALYTFDPRQLRMTEKIPSNAYGVHYYDVLKDRRGRFWTGTNQGLWQLDAATHRILKKYTLLDGLPGLQVFRVVDDSSGRIWMSTSDGICIFNPDTRRFYPQDKRIFLPGQLWHGPNGELWLSHGNKIQIFRPERFREPRPSRVYLTGLKVNEKDTLFKVSFRNIAEIRLQPGQDALTFFFSANDLLIFDKTSFQYKLEGLQTKWVHNGQSHRASFVNLPPGAYTFRVRPEDAGEDSFYDATLKVIVTDFFWQRAWFQLLAAVLLTALLIGLAFFGHTRQLHARNLKLKARLVIQEERNRISRDLHDDLGSGLGAISLLSEIALSKGGTSETRAELGKIATTAHDLSERIHEIIWAANPKNDTLEKLIGYLHQYAVMLFNESSYDLDAQIPEFIPATQVPGDHRRALFLAYKEALHNIVRHAQASRVKITFLSGANSLGIRIEDNGHGFDPSALPDCGNGLSNMCKRMEEIGGHCNIRSDGNGTTVSFTVPL